MTWHNLKNGKQVATLQRFVTAPPGGGGFVLGRPEPILCWSV
jgi:hypothetical protein